MEKEKTIPITEDLMYEHGLLNRILLVYEKLLSLKGLNYELVFISAQIVRVFIENYHEKIEETYIFPLFDKNPLVKILLKQHTSGRKLTDKILKYAENKENEIGIRKCIKKFVYMYRAHETREDTELFPQVRTLVSEREFERISKISEYMEEGQYEKILQMVINIEKELKINNLKHYTPKN